MLYEHTLVSPRDLSKLNAAFFTMNGVISVVFFAFIAADLLAEALELSCELRADLRAISHQSIANELTSSNRRAALAFFSANSTASLCALCGLRFPWEYT